CFFTHTAPAVISPLSLHDALPISNGTFLSTTSNNASITVLPVMKMSSVLTVSRSRLSRETEVGDKCNDANCVVILRFASSGNGEDRKSTRLNSSHVSISYAVFCLK